MTHNQIDLANFRETVKHNRQTELENRRHNTATESLTGRQTDESIRHNVASEGISRDTVAENVRHNVSTENINWYSARSLANLQEQQARVQQSEIGERSRTNDITQQGNLLSYDTNMIAAQGRQAQGQAALQQAETQSHNLTLQENRFNWQQQVDKAQATQAAVNNATNAITSIIGGAMRAPGTFDALYPSNVVTSPSLTQQYYQSKSQQAYRNLK